MSQDERDREALRELLRVVRERNLDPMEVGAEIVRQFEVHPDMTTEQIAAEVTSATVHQITEPGRSLLGTNPNEGN